MWSTSRTRGRDYKLSDKVCARAARVESDLLGNHTSKAETENVDLFETHRVDEGSDVACHLGDGVRDLPRAVAYASIVEENNTAGLGDDRHEERIPEIDARTEELKEK